MAPTSAQLRILRFMRDNPDATAYWSPGIRTADFVGWEGSRAGPRMSRTTLGKMVDQGWLREERGGFRRGSRYTITPLGIEAAGDEPYDDGVKDKVRYFGWEVSTSLDRDRPSVNPVAIVSDTRKDGDVSVQDKGDYDAGRTYTHLAHPSSLFRSRADAMQAAATIHRRYESLHARKAEVFEHEAESDTNEWEATE